MMKYIRLLILFFAPLGLIACQSTKKVAPPVETPQPSEWITLSINEAIEFQFKKFEESWSGTFAIYTLNSADEKIAQRHFISADDSTWNDFNQFVEFLNLYKIEPQHEIEGWYPDSGELPHRVYAFEMFDGEEIKSFTYQDPEKKLIQYWQFQSVLTFVTFVQNDLNWREVKSE